MSEVFHTLPLSCCVQNLTIITKDYYIIKEIIVNKAGSPVQIQIKKAVSKKTGKDYEFLSITIGQYGFPMVFFRSPLEKKEVQRVLAEGSTNSLLDD